MGREEKDGVETESSAVFSSQTSNQVRPSAESGEVGGASSFWEGFQKAKERRSQVLSFSGFLTPNSNIRPAVKTSLHFFSSMFVTLHALAPPFILCSPLFSPIPFLLLFLRYPWQILPAGRHANSGRRVESGGRMEGANFAVRRLTGQKGERERERERRGAKPRRRPTKSPFSPFSPRRNRMYQTLSRHFLALAHSYTCVICAALEERGEAAESSFLLRNSLKRKEGEGPFIEWGEGIQNRPLDTDGIGRVESGEGGLGKARVFVAFLKAQFCTRNPFHVAFLPQ